MYIFPCNNKSLYVDLSEMLGNVNFKGCPWWNPFGFGRNLAHEHQLDVVLDSILCTLISNLVVLVTLSWVCLLPHLYRNFEALVGRKLGLRRVNLCLGDKAWDTIFLLNHVESDGKLDNLAKLFLARNSFFHGLFCPLLDVLNAGFKI